MKEENHCRARLVIYFCHFEGLDLFLALHWNIRCHHDMLRKEAS